MGDFSLPPQISLTHLDVETELLQAFEEGFFVARHKCLHVRVDAEAHLRRLLLDLQLNAERMRERRTKITIEIQDGQLWQWRGRW